ncbi:heme-binding protein [Luteimonas sp. R10]|uniref:heme-binding protein n=1 Tax=Luteimonas sp. R10 TaxID=3108176 RepID=UPI0030862CA4|nr:heme-binding protein [Luteimonas sp. R10]
MLRGTRSNYDPSGADVRSVEKGNHVVLALPDAMPLEGGLQLSAGGRLVGGIGVSGVQSSQDGVIAKAGADLLAR